jgi:hypothetical protein
MTYSVAQQVARHFSSMFRPIQCNQASANLPRPRLQLTTPIAACSVWAHVVQGWGLHIWGDVEHPTPWSSAKQPTGSGPDSPYWDVVLQTSAKHVGLLIHKGEEKAAGTSRHDTAACMLTGGHSRL